MDILLIGNGFDLAHDLPTTYKDFLDFLEKVHPLNYSTLPSLHFDSFIRNPSNITTLNSIRELCFKNNINNIWYDYFRPKTTGNQNWCDFEKEIEYPVRQLEIVKEIVDKYRTLGFTNDNFPHSLVNICFLEKAITSYCQTNSSLAYPKNIQIENTLLHYNDNYYYIELTIGTPNPHFSFERELTTNSENNILKISLEDIVNFVLNQLKNFTKCFELYLAKLVNTLKCPRIPFINTLLNQKDIKLITFNYTNIFEIYRYVPFEPEDYCFIHGQACSNDNDNLVLGIDEKKTDIDPLFTGFRKYWQRAFKNCNILFRQWINDIKSDNKSNYNRIGYLKLEHHLHIIGHSLTPSDRIILNELITLENMHTTIYYHSEYSRMSLMQNLAAILGYEMFSYLIENQTVTFEQGTFNSKSIDTTPNKITR